MIDKKVYRLTNVELYDFITNGSRQFSPQDLRQEWEARKLNSKQESKIEVAYQQYRKFEKQRQEVSLTNKEYLTLLVFPFFTPKPKWRNDHFSQSEFDHYKMHGFHKKLVQVQNVRQFGILFWILLIVVAIIIYEFYK